MEILKRKAPKLLWRENVYNLGFLKPEDGLNWKPSPLRGSATEQSKYTRCTLTEHTLAYPQNSVMFIFDSLVIFIFVCLCLYWRWQKNYDLSYLYEFARTSHVRKYSID